MCSSPAYLLGEGDVAARGAESARRPHAKTPPGPTLLRPIQILVETGIGREALEDKALFEAVRRHREIYFRRGGDIHVTMCPGSFRLIPPSEHRAVWQRDYDAMRESMFYGPPAPTFPEILSVLETFERAINALRGA